MTESEKALELFEGDFTNGGIIEFTQEEIMVVRKALQGVAECENLQVDYDECQDQCLKAQRNALDNLTKYKVLKAKSQGLLIGARHVHDTFVKDQEQGYKSNTRQFAIDILGKSLEVFNSDETGVGL